MSNKCLPHDTRYLRWHVTAWHVGVVAIVAHITAHDVVAVVTFWDLIVWIYTDLWRTTRYNIHTAKYTFRKKKSITQLENKRFRLDDYFDVTLLNVSSGTNLEDVGSRFHICYVNPLAVDVCVVGIKTSRAQALNIGQHPYETFYIQTDFDCIISTI